MDNFQNINLSYLEGASEQDLQNLYRIVAEAERDRSNVNDTGYSSFVNKSTSDILGQAAETAGIDDDDKDNNDNYKNVEDNESRTKTDTNNKGKSEIKCLTKSVITGRRIRPDVSYKEIIAKILLENEKGQMSLNEITKQVAIKYEYYANSKSNWASSIRHTLSVADCFVKAGRAKGGRGYMWKIAEPYLKFFRRGDFDMKSISNSISPLAASSPKPSQNEIANRCLVNDDYTYPALIESFDSLIPPIENDYNSTTTTTSPPLHENLREYFSTSNSNTHHFGTYSALTSAIDNYSLDYSMGSFSDCMYDRH